MNLHKFDPAFLHGCADKKGIPRRQCELSIPFFRPGITANDWLVIEEIRPRNQSVEVHFHQAAIPRLCDGGPGNQQRQEYHRQYFFHFGRSTHFWLCAADDSRDGADFSPTLFTEMTV